MKFKTFQLFVDKKFMELDEMKKICEDGEPTFRHNKEFFEIELEILENRFLWMSCQYDNAELYIEHVWDSVSQKRENNPRKKSQIECRKQLFVCYDCDTNVLYINDMQKRAFLSEYFSVILNKNVGTKNIIRSLDDFQQIVNTLKQVKFIQQRNIMTTSTGSIFEQTANIYGFDAPQRMYMKLDYNSTPIKKMKGFIHKLKSKRDIGEFEDIIIVGEDDNGIEHSFDFSSIIKSVIIEPSKNENGQYFAQDVKNHLLSEIR